MRTLLLAALFLPATLPAQTTTDVVDAIDVVDAVVLATHAQAPSPDSFIGTYETGRATLYVARSGRRLVLTLAGQPALDAFADVPANPTFNTRAEALLRGAFDGNSDRLAAALPAHRREAGTRDFTRLLAALTGRRGDAQSVQALGTVADADGVSATFVRVRFAEGEELLKLKWRDGRLALITRGALPQVTAYPIRGAAHRFAVLDEAGAPVTLLVFGDEHVTARRTGYTLVAARSF